MNPGHARSPAVIAALVALMFLPASPPSREIGPEADLCAEINALPAGSELVLRPGDYRGPCTIRNGGSAGAPLVIRAQDLQRRPRIVYTERAANVLAVKADHVTIRGIAFGPTRPDVDGVRIYSRSDVTVEDCEFSGLGGIAVVANYLNARRITVRRNVIVDSEATAMYFGCHEGTKCVLSDVVVEGNYIHRVRAAEGQIGYGLQIKLNSTAVIRDNLIVDTKGPGIMVYGSRDPSRASVVERNLVAGSRTSSGIHIGGGPVIVRNNIAVSNKEAGIGLQDYGKRGLLRGVAVIHNTVYDNGEGGIRIPESGVHDVTIVNNAVHARSGTSALPPSQPALRLEGNADCTHGACFVDPGRLDFSPDPGSRLIGLGHAAIEAGIPRDDFFGARRGMPPIVGAVELPHDPLSFGIKR